MKTKIYNGPQIGEVREVKRGVATLKIKNRRGRFLLMQRGPREPLRFIQREYDGDVLVGAHFVLIKR